MQTYDPAAKKKKDFLKACMEYAPDSPLDCPLRVNLRFNFKRPKNHYRTGKYSHMLKPSAPKHHTQKPDKDNLGKFVMDALNGVFWRDDCLICCGETEKEWRKFDSIRVEIIEIGA